MNTILIVDDEPDTLAVLEWLLRSEGFEVRTATDGAMAWASVQASPPDLVITDYMMPRMDGMALAAKIRQELARRIPIIVTSAAASLPPGSLDGYDAALRKPLDFAALLAAVRELLPATSSG